MLYSYRILALCSVIVFGGCATAPASPWGVMGAVNRTDQGFAIYGVPGWNEVSAITYVVPRECFGKRLLLSVEYRTPNGIRAGTAPFHGVHVDYEMRQRGVFRYPADYLVDPSPNWRTVTRSWDIPADADRVVVRVGVQGVEEGAQGLMEVHKIAISGC